MKVELELFGAAGDIQWHRRPERWEWLQSREAKDNELYTQLGSDSLCVWGSH